MSSEFSNVPWDCKCDRCQCGGATRQVPRRTVAESDETDCEGPCFKQHIFIIDCPGSRGSGNEQDLVRSFFSSSLIEKSIEKIKRIHAASIN